MLDIRVPQIVKPDARQTGAAADAPELAGNIVRAERRAVLTDADIIALVVGFAVFPAVFLLAAAKIGQIPPQRVRQRQRAVTRAGFDIINIENPPVRENSGVVDDHAPRTEVDRAPPQPGALAPPEAIACGEDKRRLSGGLQSRREKNIQLCAVVDLPAEAAPLGQHDVIRGIIRDDLERDGIFQTFVHDRVEFRDRGRRKALLELKIDEILKIHRPGGREGHPPRIKKRPDMLFEGIPIAVHRILAHLRFHLAEPAVHKRGKGDRRLLRVAQPHQLLGAQDKMNIAALLKNANIFHDKTS